ncbi:aspartate/glutamate racemase family protein [Streptomyces sp. NPDC033538]|uniref:aspartate/glutamate racemase family protein n=1 Tax=Streptomyces sp. NPDC033538 TaxID=3155367 RepID=UPI0034022324
MRSRPRPRCGLHGHGGPAVQSAPCGVRRVRTGWADRPARPTWRCCAAHGRAPRHHRRVSPGRSVRKSAPGCRYDEAPAGPGMLDAFREAAGDGAEAVFVSCFGGDPGVRAAREIVGIPVVGGFEPAVLPCLALGERTGVITVLSSTPRGLRSCGWSLRCGWGCGPAATTYLPPRPKDRVA